MSDDRPPCTLLPGALSTCYCTGRPGCQSPRAEEDECDDCRNPLCGGDCQDDLIETYPGSGIYE
jgi:hypothetical protein